MGEINTLPMEGWAYKITDRPCEHHKDGRHKGDCSVCVREVLVEANAAILAKLDAAADQVRAMESVLSGGYHQGMNGLVVDRRQAEIALKGSPRPTTANQQVGPPQILCECGHPLEVHPGLGRCQAVDKLGFASCRCEKFA